MYTGMRSQEQTYWDLYSVLKLFEVLNEAGRRADNLKIQKLTFLHELKGQSEGLRSAHYKFFRYTYGPYSKILAQDVEFLEERGLITKTTRQLTKRGQFLLEILVDEIQSAGAKRAVELIEATTREYAKLRSSRLVDRVYAMEVPVVDLGGKRVKVRDISTFLDILDPLHSDLADIDGFNAETVELIKEELEIDPADLESTSPSYKASVADALERMQAAIQ